MVNEIYNFRMSNLQRPWDLQLPQSVVTASRQLDQMPSGGCRPWTLKRLCIRIPRTGGGHERIVAAKLRKEWGNYRNMLVIQRNKLDEEAEMQSKSGKKYKVGLPESSFRLAIQVGHGILAKLRTEDGDQLRF